MNAAAKVPRALFFLAELGGGGAQRTLLNLAAAMPKDRFAVELAIGNMRGPALQWLDPRVVCHDLGGRRLAAAVMPLARLIRERGYDAILSTMLDANVATAIAARLAGGRAALILRETNSQRARDDLGGLRRAMSGFAYRRADLVVALSEGVRRELIEDAHLDARRCVTIPNPVMVSDFARRVQDARRSASPWPDAAPGPRIVGVGRLIPQKGFDLLLEAVARHVPGAQVMLLGDGPDRAALAAQADRLGIGGRLSMPGFVQDTATYLAHADLFALSSRWEGFGHVIVEAMAAGLPVVATNCPHGPADILDEGRTGMLVPPHDADALGCAIARVLGDPALRLRLSQAGPVAAERYESGRIAGEYADALRDAISRRASRGPA